MFYKKLKIILFFLIIPSFLFPQNICYVMENFIRPYKNLTQLIDNSLKKSPKYIIKKENFWKINNCSNIIVFGEETTNIVREKFYNENSNFIYTFVVYRNSVENLRKNESLYYLQPDPDYIFKNVKKILKDKKKWLVFYTSNQQKRYLIDAVKFSAFYNIDLNLIYASKKLNLNTLIEKYNYNIFWFIPDPLYFSPYIVEYLLEKLLLLKKCSVGFNSFFYKSGATISFEIDYKYTAIKILKNLKEKKHGYFSFSHKILVNKKSLKYLENDTE